jgi:hypothetical protein
MSEVTAAEKRRLKWKDTAEMEAYKALAALHNVQETIFWTRNNILAIIQTALVAALFSVLTAKDPVVMEWLGGPRLPATLICTAGLCMAVVWILVVIRTDYIFSRTLKLLSDMEAGFKLRPDEPFEAFTRFVRATRPGTELRSRSRQPVRDEEHRPKAFQGWRLSCLWGLLGGAFLVIWIIALGVIWRCRSEPCEASSQSHWEKREARSETSEDARGGGVAMLGPETESNIDPDGGGGGHNQDDSTADPTRQYCEGPGGNQSQADAQNDAL